MMPTVTHKGSKKRATTEVRQTRGRTRRREPQPQKPLTPRLVQVLRFIDSFSRQHGYAPSFPEISAGIGVASHATSYQHVVQLKHRGLLTSNPKFKRSIELTAAGRKITGHKPEPIILTA